MNLRLPMWSEKQGQQSKALPNRSDIPKEQCWDTACLFENDQLWEEKFEAFEKGLDEAKSYAGQLSSSGSLLLEAFNYYKNLERQLELFYTYAHLKHDEDTGVGKYTAYVSKVYQAFSKVGALSAFLVPELNAISDERMAELMAEEPELSAYEQAFRVIRRGRAHTLSDAEERLLAKAGVALMCSSKTFRALNDADLPFPMVKDEEGQDIQLSHSRIGKLVESRDRRVRQETFQKLYQMYGQFRNTFAELLGSNVEVHNFSADLRHFESARQAALFENGIPESVYDNLIETVGAHRPLLHRYVERRKAMLGVEELHSYDLYVPLSTLDIEVTFEEAKRITLEALKPLGSRYMEVLHKAFDEGWIDYAENKGKRSGAYSNGCYDSKPYILISWQNTLDNLYTLVHELGHSVHSYFTRTTQPYLYGEYSIFLAEIASTTNENLLTDYLLKNESDPVKRLHYINHYLDGFKGTVFRQTQFAEFEYKMHRAAQEGTPLTADFLSELYAGIQKATYGPHLTFDEEIAMEWARIPHFYYNFYVYQYSTGFSAATAFAKAILDPADETAVDRYIGFLSAGLSKDPLDVLLDAGLDMSSPKPIEEACAVFARYLEEFEALTAQS